MAGRIRALVLDVDGVLTDGGILLDGNDGEWKRFHSRDGVGIKLALQMGWQVLFLTARRSPPAQRRAEELGAAWAIGISKKDVFLEEWLQEYGIPWESTAFVGDDLQDLCCLRRVGWPIAVADAVEEVKEAARHVTRRPGGQGAVRDAVDWLLDQTGWRKQAVAEFLARSEGFSVGDPENKER